jgi:hypothetical protein
MTKVTLEKKKPYNLCQGLFDLSILIFHYYQVGVRGNLVF